MKYFYELTISSSPHIHSPVTTKTIMRDVLIALAPALVGSVCFFGFRALFMTLLSAAANAKNNNGLDTATLTVKECVFDESVRIRRYWPTARGSAHPIARRLCHCKVVLTDAKEAK